MFKRTAVFGLTSASSYLLWRAAVHLSIVLVLRRLLMTESIDSRVYPGM